MFQDLLYISGRPVDSLALCYYDFSFGYFFISWDKYDFLKWCGYEAPPDWASFIFYLLFSFIDFRLIGCEFELLGVPTTDEF